MRSMLFILPLALTAIPAFAAETVPTPAFDTVQLRGGGSVTVRPGPVQRVTIVNGSTQFTSLRVERSGQLRIDACNARCPRNYDLRIVIEGPTAIDAAITGGGSIAFAPGFRPESDLSVAISGGGQIDARSVQAANISAAINGGGRILAGRPSRLSAAVNGGGEVRYAGSPHVSSVVNGGGAVHRAD
ncbi:MAG: DUF2807 domain-containing protein [Pseudomonadota bacterium]|nr:DUF2807 domain-containing protein [Sphingomonas sp.]MDQ3482219.1 DUF2807 domain-containing protein [Pseudomonadota bacterium]